MKNNFKRNPGAAAILSFLVPGLGQIYNGDIFFGFSLLAINIAQASLMIFVFKFVPVAIINSVFVTITATFDAYHRAIEKNERE
jgi:TM2 domain-containing membrane protein YozV